jgi:hypothetical protein
MLLQILPAVALPLEGPVSNPKVKLVSFCSAMIGTDLPVTLAQCASFAKFAVSLAAAILAVHDVADDAVVITAAVVAGIFGVVYLFTPRPRGLNALYTPNRPQLAVVRLSRHVVCC